MSLLYFIRFIRPNDLVLQVQEGSDERFQSEKNAGCVKREEMAAVHIMDSQAQEKGAIGLLYGCSRVILWHRADDTPCKTGGGDSWNPGYGLVPILEQS